MIRATIHPSARTAALLALGVAATAGAEAPLVLGDIAGFGPTPPSMAVTPDGATWVAWISNQCFGALRVQRIAPDGTLLVPGGLEFDLPDDCNSFTSLITACPDDTVVASSGPHPLPPVRVDATGTELWNGALTTFETFTVGAMLTLDGGDVLLAWLDGSTIRVARHAPDAAAVWAQSAAIPTLTGSNKRLLPLVPDGADGAYVFWDEPSSYTRSIWVARVTAAGATAWPAPYNVVPIDGPPSFSGSSRHTDPVTIDDGRGNAVLVWTFGAESPNTPVPLRMQVVRPDGTGAFEPEGRRISLAPERQYGARLARDPATGDILVGWRDDYLENEALRAQRMTIDGMRTWGDEGVPVTPLGFGNTSHYDVAWNAGGLSLVVADAADGPEDASVVVHRLDGAGAPDGAPIPISGPTLAGPVRAVAVGDDVVGSWMEEPANGHVLAARIDDGTGPVPGDTNGDGVVDVTDLVNVVLDWSTDGAAHGGDVTGDGLVDVGDLVAVILGWTG